MYVQCPICKNAQVFVYSYYYTYYSLSVRGQLQSIEQNTTHNF